MNKIQLGIIPAIAIAINSPALASPPSVGINPPKPMPTIQKPGKRSYWIGKPVIFLELRKTDQAAGYSGYMIHQVSTEAKNLELETEDGNLRYDKFVGKTLTVIDIQELTALSYNITFKVNQTGIMVYANNISMPDNTLNLVPIQELQEAQKSYLGKTIYATSRSLFTYDSTTDTENTVPINFAQPLKITKIVRGLGSSEPLWFIVREKSGQEGFFKVSADYFLDDTEGLLSILSSDWTENDLKSSGYTQSIINNINDGEVEIGMNAEQVKYAIGEPDKKNVDQYADGKHEHGFILVPVQGRIVGYSLFNLMRASAVVNCQSIRIP